MNIDIVNVNKITADPNQPRHTIDEERVREMAQSIITEGVINPIEIDDKNVIITGELRWRAAKKAGLMEVPCKRLHLTNGNRFRRQVIENIHHNTMTAWDTAVALEHLIKLPRRGQPYSTHTLAEEIGKSQEYISEMLLLLKEKADIRKYLQTKDAKPSLLREVRRTVPEKYVNQVKQKIIDRELNGGRTVRELGKALRRAPEKAEQLLKQNYQEEEYINYEKIKEIAPIKDLVETSNYGTLLKISMNNLLTLLKRYESKDVLGIDRAGIEHLAQTLIPELQKITTGKFLEGEII